MNSDLHESILQLVRLGIRTSEEANIPKKVDWFALKELADKQGLSAIVLDALNTDPSASSGQVGTNLSNGMPLEFKLEWIGEVLQDYEQRYDLYEKAIAKLAGFYKSHGIKMMVLKGYGMSLNYPIPNHPKIISTSRYKTTSCSNQRNTPD